MKKGDRVRKAPMWKYDEATGEVIQARRDGYIVVKWDNINGDWFYTTEQAKSIEVINESR